MTTVNLGKIKYTNRGLWSDNSVTYRINDVVKHCGMLFICVKEHVSWMEGGNAPVTSMPDSQLQMSYTGSRNKSFPWNDTWSTTDIDAQYVFNGVGGMGRGIRDYVNTFYWEPLGNGISYYTTEGRNVFDDPDTPPTTATGADETDSLKPGQLTWLRGGIFVYNGWVVTPTWKAYYDNPLQNFFGGWEVIHEGDIIPRNRAIAQLDGAGPPGWKGHPNPEITKPQWGNTAYLWRGNVPRNIPAGSKRPEYNHRSAGNMAYSMLHTFITADGNTPVVGNDTGEYLGWMSHPMNFTASYGPTIEKDFWDAYIMNYSSYGWGADFINQKRNPEKLKVYGDEDIVAPNANSRITTYDTSGHLAITSVNRHSNHLVEHTRNIGAKPRPIQIEWWGYRSMATLMSDGSIQMWGYNGYYAYGTDHGTAYPYGSHLGRDVFEGRRIVKLAGSGWNGANSAGHGMALDEEGEIWTWGYNGYGQCGGTRPNHGTWGGYYNGIHENFRNPSKLHSSQFFNDRKIVDIWCNGGQYGVNHVLDDQGYLWTWGYNGYGQLGIPTNSYQNSDRTQVPVRISTNWSTYKGIQKLVHGGQEAENWTAVLDGDGQLWTCGYNGWGQLGTGNTTNTGNSGSLTRRTSLNIAGSITNVWISGGGAGITWMRHSNGTLYGMGYNGHYDLSLSNSSHQSSPIAQKNVGDPMKVVYAGRSGGTSHACLTTNKDVYAIGWNGYGECGYGTTGNTNNNNNRNQPNGSQRYGWWRMSMPSPLTRKIVDIQGKGYYDGSISHQNLFQMRTLEGETVNTGRGYYWGSGFSNNHHYHPMNHGLWGT
jgi:alpha-tubulin suppressor-like RCC1 family protein